MPEAHDPHRIQPDALSYTDPPPGPQRTGRRHTGLHRRRGRRLLIAGALAVGLVGVVSGAATADNGVPFAGTSRIVTTGSRTTTTSAEGTVTIIRVRCRFWLWCRRTATPVAAPAPSDLAPTATPPGLVSGPTRPGSTTPGSTTPGSTSPAATAPPHPAPSAPTGKPAPARSVKPTATSGRTPAPATPDTNGGSGAAGAGDTRTRQILDQLNAARKSAGVAPLTMSEGLVRSAAAHSRLMADGCGLEHQCPSEAGLGSRISAQGAKWTSAGENIGYGGPVDRTSAAVVAMGRRLTASMLAETPPNDGHRKNILGSSFRHVGIVLHQGSDGTVWMTQDFSS